MVPHALTPQQKQQRVDICSSLLTRHRREPFLDRLVTGDEMWVLYHNNTRKRQWVPKEGGGRRNCVKTGPPPLQSAVECLVGYPWDNPF